VAFNRDQRREHNNEQRKAERDIQLPEVSDPKLRRELEQDPERWLGTLFPHYFSSWLPIQRQIRESIDFIVSNGGDQANAYPRGIGKTAITEGEIGVRLPVIGAFKFAVLVSANADRCSEILDNIQELYDVPIEETDDLFFRLYPEVVGPIRALERSPQRAEKQTYRGEFTYGMWTSGAIRLPRVRFCESCLCLAAEMVDEVWICESCNQPMGYSRASGCMIRSFGLHEPIRGLRKGAQRPQVVVIDDPDTPESAVSDTETKKRVKTIEKDLGGLGGRRRVGRLINTTLQNDTCTSAIFTDPKRKPSWKAKRVGMVERWPTQKGLWDQYIELRQEGMQYRDDKLGREAHAFYLANREAMDEGAIVIDPFWFDGEVLPDGSQKQVSTIQAVHDAAADSGWDYVLTELQNNPPEIIDSGDEGINEGIVRGIAEGYGGRLTGLPKGICPEASLGITVFIDCGKRRLTYNADAWFDGEQSVTIDYEHVPTIDPDVVGEDAAVAKALIDLRDWFRLNPYKTEAGDRAPEPFFAVDSGDFTKTVYETIRGFGSRWYVTKGSSRPLKGGKRFEKSRIEGCQFVLMDADYWKDETHKAFMICPLNGSGNQTRGSTRLFGKDHRDHKEYAAEMVAEKLVTEFVDGKGVKAEWKKFSRDNHFFDAKYGCRCLAAVRKYLSGRQEPVQQQAPPPLASKTPATQSDVLFDPASLGRLGFGAQPRLTPGGNG